MRGAGARLLAAAVALLVGAAPARAAAPPGLPAAPPRTVTLDPFADVAAWKAVPADGVSLALSRVEGPKGGALRMAFDFHGRGGWAAARRPLPLTLPERWELRFRLEGSSPPNDLEVKLVDPSGENVWWVKRRDVSFPATWQEVRLKQRQFSFAWGPAAGGAPKEVGFLEFAVTAGAGGAGWIAVSDVVLVEPPPPAPPLPPAATATTSAPGHEASRALDGDPATEWLAGPAGGAGGEGAPVSWTADLGSLREMGGLVVRWGAGFARSYAVDLSDDGTQWRTVREVTAGNGGRDDLYLPESEARFVRLRLLEKGGAGPYALREVTAMPLAYGASPAAFFEAVAREAPRGSYPRWLAKEQAYWTVVGVDGDREEGLLSEDGALETGAGAFSLEPFLLDGDRLDRRDRRDRLVTWNDVKAEQSLADGDLPIPSVTWRAGDLTLTTTAVATGAPGASALVARYRLESTALHARHVRLFVAVRPFQVNPPWQFLGTAGGPAPIRSLAWDGRRLAVNGDRLVVPLTAPAAFGAAPFDGGDVTEFLRRGAPPPATDVTDPFGYASGAFAFDVDVAPGKPSDVVVAVPFAGEKAPPFLDEALGASALAERVLDAERRAWRGEVDRVGFVAPPAARRFVEVLRSQIAYILVNRDGPAIQPGSRSYARSWIRDGSLTSEALLRTGHAGAAKAFLEWYAPYQARDGRVPCCVDRRGADPVPENDSHGELLFLIGETVRYTGDRALAERMWPHVTGAVAAIDRLRKERRTPEYASGAKRVFYGLLPESISHEGYSAKPMHSYWDDFFALRGLKDAVALARFLGREEEAARFAAIRDEFSRDLEASIRLAISAHRIDFIPGCAELGDFDATSTTAALAPGGELARLPRAELLRTFERYWENVEKRAAGEGEAYTPYELRAVGAFVRLGWRSRALELLDGFFRDLRPAAWNQWGEVVWRDPRAPKFVGDIPHTWVGSDYVRSFLDLVAYEREDDGTLVVGAGVPAAWGLAEGGFAVRGLRTPWGALTASWSAGPVAGSVTVRVSGLSTVPPGGLAVRSPFDAPARAALDGRDVSLTPAGELLVRSLPAEVVFRP